MHKSAQAQPDSQQLYTTILQTADFTQEEQQKMIDNFEAAVYARTLKSLLTMLPADQRQKLETTMHFQPDFFLSRVLAILQAFATPEQIIEIMDKTSEETFMEFFDNFLVSCSAEQKQKINQYLEKH
jgi:hypothetical protein